MFKRLSGIILCIGLILGVAVNVNAATNTVTVSVVDSIGTESTGYNYSYNSKGLVSEVDSFLKGDNDYNVGGSQSTFKYNSDGTFKKVKHVQTGGFVGQQTYIYTYKYKDNKLVKIVDSYSVLNSEPEKQTLSVKYYKDNRIKSIGKTKFTYDENKRILPYSNGYVKYHYTDEGDITVEGVSLVYNGDNVVEKKYDDGSLKINYKSINVNKKLVKQIKAQQWAIVNDIFSSWYYYQY